jgi:hypothetical protein
MPILNYTTEVAASESVSEITALLVRHKVKHVGVEYDGFGNEEAITFQLEIAGAECHFRIPCNHQAVLAVMRKQNVRMKLLSEAQARRVAWRIIKTAIEVQLARVECNQAEMGEVLFEYVIVDRSGLSVYKQFKEHNQKQLAEGNAR